MGRGRRAGVGAEAPNLTWRSRALSLAPRCPSVCPVLSPPPPLAGPPVMAPAAAAPRSPPPQCPAGWGKMPKWPPATTLDSPTAGLLPNTGEHRRGLPGPPQGPSSRPGPRATPAPCPAPWVVLGASRRSWGVCSYLPVCLGVGGGAGHRGEGGGG